MTTTTDQNHLLEMEDIKVEMKGNKVTSLDPSTSFIAAMKTKSSFGKGGRRVSKESIASSGFLAHGKMKGTHWISRTFYQRECFKFVQDKAKPEFCQCGMKKVEHKQDGFIEVKDSEMKWTPEQCTKKVSTRTFGEIEFAEDPSTRKPYIRLSHDTNPLPLLKLLTQKWQLNVPNLVISVTGGAKSFKLKPPLKEAFSKGLIKVAVSTGAWIITGGTSTGVMKHVGEAVMSRTQIGHQSGKINCIGIAPWGQVDNSDCLVSKNGKGCYPASYTTATSDPSKAPLDMNHSHFILVDNGTTGQYGVEIGLRSTLEGAILHNLKTESSSSAGSIGIPVVILCLEGGPNTIATMAEAIKKGVPAVVIDGSGRAADVVAFAFKHVKFNANKQIQEIDEDFVDDVKKQVEKVFGEKSRDRVYQQIEELLRDRKMVSVYRLKDDNSSQDIDLAILKALLKANQHIQSQLRLALAWNRIDVAKSEIFIEGHRQLIEMEHLHESMFTALIDDKVDFVSLFINEGVKMKDFLTVDLLCSLYAALPRNAPVMQLLYVVSDKSKDVSMFNVGQLVEELMGDKFKSQYKSDDYCGRVIEIGSGTRPVRDEGVKMAQDAWLDLFVWATLANRREMARLIWSKGRENIAMALMATKLLKGLVEKVLSERDMVDIGASFMEHASEWEKTAIGVLDECRKQDDELAQRLVVKELPNFGHLTSVDIAVSAEDQDFIAHPTCQALFSKLWMGTMELSTHTWQVAVCFFAPPVVPFMISFSGDEDLKHDAMQQRPSTVIQNYDKSQDIEERVVSSRENDEEMNIGSTATFKDFEGRESVELHNYESEEKDPIYQLVHIEDPNDAIDATLRYAKLSKFEKMLRFYQAPFVKFFANVLSYLIFLGLYSYNLLSKFSMKPHWSEYVLQVWVLTLIIEEIRQVITQEPKSFLRKLEWYFSSTWNIADVFSLISFLIATVLRYAAWKSGNKEYLDVARIILATDVIIFIIRLLQIFSVNKNLGPKLVMIQKMLHDLKYFIFILAIFIIGYGVAFQSVRFPRTPIGKALIGVLNKPYWQMYGELFIEDILEDQKNCTTGLPVCLTDPDEDCSTDYGKYVAPIYMALYMLFTNILLLNLLIAIFNYTFEKVQDASDKVWKFQRYELILEYHDRPALTPPLIIVSHVYLGMRWIVQRLRCCGCRPLKGSTMKFKLSSDENEQLRMWEYTAAESYSYISKLLESETLDERVKDIQSRIDNLSTDMAKTMDFPLSGDAMMRQETAIISRRAIQTRQAPLLESRISSLEHKLDQVLELLIQQTQKQAALLQAGRSLSMEEAPDRNQITTKITSIHIKARTTPYPNSIIQRARVPDAFVPWEVSFPEYMPAVYTAPVVLAQPVWADPDILSMEPKPVLPFNSYDHKEKTNRESFLGTYEVVDNLPRNPMGRTGIVGRGLLGKWGPNHAVDPVVTRWKRSSSGIVLDKGKRVLEFVAIQRKDNHQWAIPGGMVDADEKISETLRREFSEEAFAKLDMPEQRRQTIIRKIDDLFKRGTEVYKGYVDDPRNTDNAWMETVAYNFHDDTGEIFGDLELKAGDDAEAVRWQRVSGNIPLFASHVGIVEKVAGMHDAAFY
ncbi:transient receptor potential cation channel subfamily M member-like 2 isoform X2 [Rhopilema esculentum]|uniref:transient receptor potential cation channel subfamily M member-like 2 isoform X2 n=1 Tax=Rhopilema esculentum TaxID=499914 RepID=UPI0031D98AF9